MSEQISLVWRKGPEMQKSYKCDKERILENVEMSKSLEIEKIDENVRQKANERIHERELIGTRNINPFMKNNNYVKDLSVQDQFLRPQNSSEDNTYLFFAESPPQLQKSAPSLLSAQVAQNK